MWSALPPIDTVLDVGGFAHCWDGSPLPPRAITLLNSDASAATGAQAAGFPFLTGDGCALPFPERSFDLLFSNSVIEHVGDWNRQQAFAREARRVGRHLWIQTPAREFFIEPHWIAPFIHWFSVPWQRRLARHFTVRGWIERPSPAAIDALLAEIRLLTFAEMRQLFPDCTILRERFCGLTKSYIALRLCPPTVKTENLPSRT